MIKPARSIRKNAWKEIAQELGMDMAEAQRRYNSIRTNFSKYLKYQKSLQELEEKMNPRLRRNMSI